MGVSYLILLVALGGPLFAGEISQRRQRDGDQAKFAQGLERRLRELEHKWSKLPSPTIAETVLAATYANYLPGTKQAAKAKATLEAKLKERRQAEVPLLIEIAVLAQRLQTYRVTGNLPDSVPNAEELAAIIENPWGSGSNGDSKGCTVLDRCRPTPTLDSYLPTMIKQLERFHAAKPPLIAKAPAATNKRTPQTLAQASPLLLSPESPKLAMPKAKTHQENPNPRNETVEDLIALVSSAEPRQRALAADMLGNRGLEASSAVPALRKALRDRDPRVRASAALALGGIAIATPEIIEDLQRSLLDPNEDVRLSSRSALGRLSTGR